MNPPVVPILLSLVALAGPLRAEEKFTPFQGNFRDPRNFSYFRESIRKGEEVESPAINHAILLIQWRPAPDRQNGVFQISGLDGYYERRHIEAFLREFYRLSAEQRAAENLITATNQWGGFPVAPDFLEELSKQYGFSVFTAGGWGFPRAELLDEPKGRLARIKEAFRLATLGEPDPRLTPQRKILNATERLPRAMDPRNLEPVPPATLFRAPELGNVWYSRPYSPNGQWLE